MTISAKKWRKATIYYSIKVTVNSSGVWNVSDCYPMSNKCLKKPDRNTKAKTRSTINITVPQAIHHPYQFLFFVLQCPDNQSQWLAEKKRPHPRPDLRKHWGQRSLRWSGRHQQELVLRGGSHETKNAQHVHQGSQVRSCCLESTWRSTNVVLMLGPRLTFKQHWFDQGNCCCLESMRRWINVVLMQGQRRRRWSNIDPYTTISQL